MISLHRAPSREISSFVSLSMSRPDRCQPPGALSSRRGRAFVAIWTGRNRSRWPRLRAVAASSVPTVSSVPSVKSMPKGHVPLWTVELPHDRPRSPSRSDAWERALSSGIIPALPPLQDPSPRNGDQQRFAFALTIPVLVAIHPKDVSKLKVNLAHEPDTVRVRKILHLVTDKIRATGFDARCVDDAAGADLLVKRPAKAGDEHPFAHADKWTVSKAVGVAGFGFSEEDPARFFEKGVRHAAMELTTPMLTRLFRGEQRVDEVEVAVVLGHLKRALDVFEPVAEFPMAVRCWKRDTGKRGVARWDVLEMAAVSAAAVMFEGEHPTRTSARAHGGRGQWSSRSSSTGSNRTRWSGRPIRTGRPVPA